VWFATLKTEDSKFMTLRSSRESFLVNGFSSSFPKMAGVKNLFRIKYVGSRAPSKVYWKPRRLPLLGWPDGDEEIILLIWFFLK
jgi:hypothetical protein